MGRELAARGANADFPAEKLFSAIRSWICSEGIGFVGVIGVHITLGTSPYAPYEPYAFRLFPGASARNNFCRKTRILGDLTCRTTH
jgi:hypothetical protein